MDLPAIAERLKANVPGLRTVGLAGDLAAVLEGKLPNQTGSSAFVLVAAEQGLPPSRAAGAYVQTVRNSVAVVLTFREISNRSADKLIDEVEEMKSAVCAALAGWMPPGAIGALALVEGATVALRPGLYAWGYQFAANSQLRFAS